MPNLFKKELERLGVVDSRSESLAKATNKMHSALCYLDPSQALLVRKLMGEKFFNYINWYGTTEDLNNDMGALNFYTKSHMSTAQIRQLELPFK
jgi:hypothetical protein|tara:strand:+ start:147 stop:428 length:282 start_codon:yes stop_codon:yes gene_type:complete